MGFLPWVWIPLKNLKSNKSSYLEFLNALTGNGCKSRSSVGAGCFSGKIKWRNETATWVSDAIHLSDITRMKYCGGKVSNTGTKNFT